MAFVKGKSGNPGGRPKKAYDVQALARECTPEAIAALREALAVPKERVSAAAVLLDRAWGKAIQTTVAEVTHRYVARVPDKAASPQDWLEKNVGLPAETQH
jgi:hypothetical protein